MKAYLLAGALCLIAAPALASFSSLALSPRSGGWGRSHDFDSRDKADNTALSYCQTRTRIGDCRVVTWAKGGWCAAVAVHHKGDGSVVWGSASASTMEAARANAYANCAAHSGGGRCEEILADVCSH
jgi:hypothetical protein